MTCEEPARMRDSIGHYSRGNPDKAVFLERKLHRMTAALEQHLATHGCQE